MAPPVFAQFHSITAEQPSERRSSYATRLDAMYWDVVDHLYNEETHLFYRGAELLGTDVYWGPGNGWAIAGLPLILEQEFPRQDRPRYRQLLNEMAAALAALQREDGL